MIVHSLWEDLSIILTVCLALTPVFFVSCLFVLILFYLRVSCFHHNLFLLLIRVWTYCRVYKLVHVCLDVSLFNSTHAIKLTMKRYVYINDDNLAKDLYCDNRISNRKYTIWNFLPKNLWEQFRLAFTWLP